MNWDLRNRVRFAMLGAVLGVLSAGCHAESGGGIDRYMPSSESARAGVSRAMEGWLKGLTPAASGSTRPEVHVVDQTRRAD